MDLKKEISFGRKNAGQKPGKAGTARVLAKTSINLVTKEKSSVRLTVVIPAVIVIAALAALLSKFAVVDLLADLSKAQGRVSTAQTQLDADNAEIDSYGDLIEKYAHYTFSGMNDTELTSVARADILALLQEDVMPYASVGSWSVAYNTVTLPITDTSLQEVNLVVQRLNADDRVDYCTVNTAKSDDTGAAAQPAAEEDGTLVTEDEGTVTAEITIYMMDVEKGAFNG